MIYAPLRWITPAEYKPGTVAAIAQATRGKGNQKTKARRKYKDLIAAFDIETTRLTAAQHPAFAGEKGSGEQSVMYVWQLCLHHHCLIVGRTWEELSKLLYQIRQELNQDGSMMVIWVHNLSYEFQFLRAIYSYKVEDVFALDSRKVLKADILDVFELRCSYLHSNMSLDEYTKKMQVEHQKLSGAEFDYAKIRFPWTPITPDEMAYCLHDVVGLCEAIEKEMQIDGDNLYTIPLTSTGYVRRDTRRAMMTAARTWIKTILPDVEVFEMLREAFRGGDTHANRYYAGQVLEDVKSADRSSSYPDVQCNCKFPMSQWWREPDGMTFEELDYMIRVRKKAVVMRVAFTNVRLSDIYTGCPYIGRDKCARIEGGVYDNGRVLEASYLETTITDVDLRIILDQYTIDIIDPYDVAYARYGLLPKEMRDVAIKYYKAKTELKGVEGQEIYYVKSKNKLNAIYGMTAQNPAKETINYVDGEWVEDDTPLEELLEDNNAHAFLTYAWGVWTTAWARYRLHEGIKLAGDNFVYCDTDSVKYLGDIDWTAYNEERMKDSQKSGAFATDPHGVTHYMGVYEAEHSYSKFATLGAKKYAYQYAEDVGKLPAGHTAVTISGVTKSKGGAELDKGDDYGTGLERFCLLDPPFTFREAGGTEALYQDNPDVGTIHIDGHDLTITPNVVIRESTYTLGITAEYASILKNSKLPLDYWAGA